MKKTNSVVIDFIRATVTILCRRTRSRRAFRQCIPTLQAKRPTNSRSTAKAATRARRKRAQSLPSKANRPAIRPSTRQHATTTQSAFGLRVSVAHHERKEVN